MTLILSAWEYLRLCLDLGLGEEGRGFIWGQMIVFISFLLEVKKVD